MAKPDAETPLLRNQLPGYTSIVAGHLAKAPGVAYLELARPHRHNSFHQELWEEFPRALRELDADESTRVIVLAAQGKNFCAGIDVAYLQRNFLTLLTPPPPPAAAAGGGSTAAAPGPAPAPACPGSQRAAMRRGILALQAAYSQLEGCRVPVLAAVQGRCIGGGVDLITACDLRLCSSGASFCVKEVDLAITADLGTLQRLPHLVGHGVAMDLALTARTVGAEEARRIGLVSTVVPDNNNGGSGGGGGSGSSSSNGRGAVVAAAVALAASIAAKPALAVQGTKRVLLHSRDHPPVSAGLDYVATWNSGQLLSADLGAVMAAGAGVRARL
ncbi:hypothetical protein Agub_g15226 [Astrephomene gubernaculifera]|uniref:Uncharacterized protein n=1 Tax=Astrephomene gubernaculifera TaxID=47775 RepID=A0AAD3E2N5_9CHLO|nr:hypothetical protein Agub_g15226 [Astrephomene gubernaculifera]